MARKRRSTEIFSMSFLDCMSCGFGAVILFFMIINSQSDITTDQTQALQAETDKLEIEVLEGRKNLALARNSIQKLETEDEEAKDKVSIIKALIAELRAELAKYDKRTLAKIEATEKLQSDIKSLEEEIKRLLALRLEDEAAGEAPLMLLTVPLATYSALPPSKSTTPKPVRREPGSIPSMRCLVVKAASNLRQYVFADISVTINLLDIIQIF